MLSTDRWLMAAGFLANGMSVNTTEQVDLDKVRDQLIAEFRECETAAEFSAWWIANRDDIIARADSISESFLSVLDGGES